MIAVFFDIGGGFLILLGLMAGAGMAMLSAIGPSLLEMAGLFLIGGAVLLIGVAVYMLWRSAGNLGWL